MQTLECGSEPGDNVGPVIAVDLDDVLGSTNQHLAACSLFRSGAT